MTLFHLPGSISQWMLLALLFLWSLALMGLAFVLMTDSYGGMGPIPIFIASGNVFAALPFLTPTGPTFLFLARSVAVLQGVAVILTFFLMDGMASTLVSMGNSKNPSMSHVAIIGTGVGIALIVLAVVTPPCLPPAPGN